MTSRLVVLSGCSAGGKSTLLAEMALRGYRVCTEPGRRVVEQQQRIGGDALPWENAAKFMQQCIELAQTDYVAAQAHGNITLFDRSMVDALAGLVRMNGALDEKQQELIASYRYADEVFMAPPWPEIYVGDSERRHGIDQALVEYQHLESFYPDSGYSLTLLPKTTVAARAEFLISALRPH